MLPPKTISTDEQPNSRKEEVIQVRKFLEFCVGPGSSRSQALACNPLNVSSKKGVSYIDEKVLLDNLVQ